MTINPSDQFGTSQLRKYLGDNPAEVIRSAESLSQLPSSVNESFELLSEVLTEARDRLREEVIEALGKKLLPWLDKNPKTLADLPFLNQITPLPLEIIEEHEFEWLRLEDRCFDPRLSPSIRNATLQILDQCDGGNRVESEKKHAEELHLKRNPPRPPIPTVNIFGLTVRQDLLFFEHSRIQKNGKSATLIVSARKSEVVIGSFSSVTGLHEWLKYFDLFKEWAGERFSLSETGQLQRHINTFESMLKQQGEEFSTDCEEFLEDPSSPAPEKFIDPLMPSSDKFDMPEFDYQ